MLNKGYKVTNNKYIEITIDKSPKNNKTYFNIELIISRKCDHPGIRFNISIFKVNISIHLYDTRHWDTVNNCIEE